MNEAQTWTVIGLFFATLVSMMGMVMRVVRAEIQALGARFEAVIVRLDALDRDVQRLYEHWMGEKP